MSNTDYKGLLGKFYNMQASKEAIQNLKLIQNLKIPKSFHSNPVSSMGIIDYYGQRMTIRDAYIKECGFTLISEDWIKPLVKWIGDRPCLEVMAGTGWLSYALSTYGVKIKATDNFSWCMKYTRIHKLVENLDAIQAINKYGSQVKFIIMSWPYMDNTAFQVLKQMREINPKCRLIYIGEWWGGCTADDEFFELAEVCKVQSFENAVKNYKRWSGINDSITLIK